MHIMKLYSKEHSITKSDKVFNEFSIIFNAMIFCAYTYRRFLKQINIVTFQVQLTVTHYSVSFAKVKFTETHENTLKKEVIRSSKLNYDNSHVVSATSVQTHVNHILWRVPQTD
ncbi:unnamed protein product [Clavelina lepadiformis]|uniref:Uncharacterized protein n=1 Tax=Clavelina lepadiformis TaxID=159417 RepID=A0ABP0FUZ2_CLALP